MNRMFGVVVFLLLAGVTSGAAIKSSGIGHGNWSSEQTWAGGVVPGNGDTVTIVSGDVVNFDVDQSGLAQGIGLTVSPGATLVCSNSPGAYYLKCNGSLTLNGILKAGVSAREPLPASVTFTIDLAGSSTINCQSVGRLELYCQEPDHRAIALTTAADIGATVLSVDTDLTGDIWAPGCEVNIDDVAGPLPDTETKAIAPGGIRPTNIILTSGLARAKAAGAKVILVTRNIRIISGKGYAITNPIGSYVAAEIRTANGINGAADCVIGGILSGCTNGNNCSSGIVHLGTISGCTYGLLCCTACTNRGTISGCNYGLYSGSGNTTTGEVSGCGYGIYHAAGMRISGRISGCLNGIYAGAGLRLAQATFVGNTYDLRRVTSAEMVRTVLGGATDNYQYNTTAVPESSYVWSLDHNGVTGAFKAWSRGGVVVSDTKIVPAGYKVSFKHTCTSAQMPCLRQEEMTLEPGQTLQVTGQIRIADDHSAWPPRLEIIDPDADPLVDPNNAALAGDMVPHPEGSLSDWQGVTISYTNADSLAKKVYVRCSARRQNGVVYEVWSKSITP